MPEEIDQIQSLVETLTQRLIDLSPSLIAAAIILLIGFIFGSSISRLILGICSKKNIDVTLSRFFASSIKLLILFLFLLYCGQENRRRHHTLHRPARRRRPGSQLGDSRTDLQLWRRYRDHSDASFQSGRPPHGSRTHRNRVARQPGVYAIAHRRWSGDYDSQQEDPRRNPHQFIYQSNRRRGRWDRLQLGSRARYQNAFAMP